MPEIDFHICCCVWPVVVALAAMMLVRPIVKR